MKRLLVAVDQDPIAAHVVETAGRLARAWGASVLVCHVSPAHRDGAERASVPERLARTIAKEAAQGLQAHGVEPAEILGRIGSPPEEILALADEHEVDLIVLGFEGLHGLERVRALGSVSRAVMEETRHPVLIVPALHEGNG